MTYKVYRHSIQPLIDWRALSILGMKYQFHSEGLDFVGPLRNTWHEAAMDAVAHGAAHWSDFDELVFTEMGNIAGIVEGSVNYENKAINR